MLGFELLSSCGFRVQGFPLFQALSSELRSEAQKWSQFDLSSLYFFSVSGEAPLPLDYENNAEIASRRTSLLKFVGK